MFADTLISPLSRGGQSVAILEVCNGRRTESPTLRAADVSGSGEDCSEPRTRSFPAGFDEYAARGSRAIPGRDELERKFSYRFTCHGLPPLRRRTAQPSVTPMSGLR